MLPSISVVTVNADPVNVLEPSNDNNFQHQTDISSDEKVAMLLKTVPSSRENKPDHEGFIADRGSIDLIM